MMGNRVKVSILCACILLVQDCVAASTDYSGSYRSSVSTCRSGNVSHEWEAYPDDQVSIRVEQKSPYFFDLMIEKHKLAKEAHNPVTANMTENHACVLDDDNIHFLCTDNNEPVVMYGRYSEGKLKILYVESGNANNHHAVCRFVFIKNKIAA